MLETPDLILSALEDITPLGDDILIYSPNWLGDSVMAMPAVQALKQENPYSSITVMVKANLVPLWEMNPDVDAIIPLKKGLRGKLEAAKVVRTGCFDKAYILPHSFCAALFPFLLRIPFRCGLKGYHRTRLLTRPIKPEQDPRRKHQVYEYLDILGLKSVERLDPPRLTLPERAVAYCWHRLYDRGWLFNNMPYAGNGAPALVGLVPGATRGVSKQWPWEHFAEVGKRLVHERNGRVLVFGSKTEEQLCSRVSETIGRNTLNLAGQTSVPELAAMLTLCNTVVSNDNGGMHLAAAVGTKVAAIFGTTDPDKTGPMGGCHRVIQEEGVSKDRRVKRNSPQARAALGLISPERVYRAVDELLVL